jgi:arylsulfatase A-like enzyme
MMLRALAACLAFVVACPAVFAADAARRPNIVFFLCDDLGSGDLSCLGSQHVRTPHIDALFARGTRLSRHWSGCAVCAPSRCVLMTGMHPGHAVVRSNREVKPEGQAPMPEGTVTLAGILRDAGYATGGFGKWGLGAPESASDPVACGFDLFFGYNCQREAHSFYPDHLWRNRERVPIDNASLAGSGPVQRAGTVAAAPPPGPEAFLPFAGRHYSADMIATEQLAFVRAHADRPFFLYVPTTVPHLALQVPEDEPSLVDYERHFGDEEPYLGGRGYVPCRRPLATYAAMITRMDREVGRLVALLDELGLTDDTIFVFSSDNGATAPGTGGIDTARLASNGPLRDWKGSPYEGGMRVPTAIAWPGRIAAGRTSDVPSGFEDWLPTLLDLAGLGERVPSAIDGRSLAAGLTGAGEFPTDRPLYRELTEAKWQAAVEGRWKAVRRGKGGRKGPSAESLPTEIYDLVADPGESRDVAADHPDVVSRMDAILDREHVPDPVWPLPFADARATAARPAVEPRGDTAKPARRPNILFILVDDQSPHDFRFYDPASTLRAPVIERLAAEGMVLDAAYHMGSFSGAVCTPSRHMIMCGRSVWHLPIGPGTPRRAKGQPATPYVAPHCPPDIVDFTLPAVFNRAGYSTMRTCKTGNSYEGANRLFTVRHDAEKRGGGAETGSAWHADRVLEYLAERQRSGDEKPFLIYFGFSHPHDTRDGTPDLLARYGAVNHADEAAFPPADPRQPPLPANWLPRHPFDNTHLDVRDEVSVSGVWKRRDERTIRNELGREFACAENIDIQIGRVLERLAALGELDNTWIFYTSDHGIAIGRHGLQGKQNLYEHTWRVPFIVKGPGVRPGSRAPGNVYLGDTLATLCDICGIESPATNEGTSFLPVLRGQKPAVRDVLYGVYSGGASPGMRAVRRGDWKLVKYESPQGGLHTQLFNLRDNPLELLAEHHATGVREATGTAPTPTQTNLADASEHAAVRTEMESLLLAEMRRLDDPYRFSDQPEPPRGR